MIIVTMSDNLVKIETWLKLTNMSWDLSVMLASESKKWVQLNDFLSFFLFWLANLWPTLYVSVEKTHIILDKDNAKIIMDINDVSSHHLNHCTMGTNCKDIIIYKQLWGILWIEPNITFNTLLSITVPYRHH